MTLTPDTKGAQPEHTLYVDSGFTSDGYYAACSCGWVSHVKRVSQAAALKDGEEHRGDL